NYIVDKLRKSGLLYGFEEYDAPVLEPLELFLAKSGSELARKQSYNFTDKGGRQLIMRPEMTPSLARMVAGGRELVNPIKWMSFPLCYRYERTQRGRVREFLQFNLDILGCNNLNAEVEVILVLERLFSALGATTEQYQIAFSSREFAAEVFRKSGLCKQEIILSYSIIDKKSKMEQEEWLKYLQENIPDSAKSEAVRKFANCDSLEVPWLLELMKDNLAYNELLEFSFLLKDTGSKAAKFDAGVVRGLDYYTGIVFEVMDTGGENRRAICGGGRYDDLVSIFGEREVSGVGFGLGILTLKLFLETYGLIPASILNASTADLYLAVISADELGYALQVAEELRDSGITVEMDILGKNLSRQFKLAEKRNIRFMAIVGGDEAATATVSLKDMNSGAKETLKLGDIPAFIKQ
ncbi:MAG: histidine--tRNA ligase, partial [FCB group bacterium]|nr:histidine--tRNA ligase [FCB group bacterium]